MTAGRQINRSRCCLYEVFQQALKLVFTTYSVIVLVAWGYWHYYQKKTGSYGWSLEESASLYPDDRQQ